MDPCERIVTAFFGVRGIGSLFYLAYAAGQVHFEDLRWLWSTVAFTIGLSVLATAAFAIGSTSCATTKGFGQDVEKVGSKIEQKANQTGGAN